MLYDILYISRLRGEMVDTHDLKSCALRRTGSTPVEGNPTFY